MLNFTGNLRVFLGVEPVDLRKSFSGLLAAVMNPLKEDLLQGRIPASLFFVFISHSLRLVGTGQKSPHFYPK